MVIKKKTSGLNPNLSVLDAQGTSPPLALFGVGGGILK